MGKLRGLLQSISFFGIFFLISCSSSPSRSTAAWYSEQHLPIARHELDVNCCTAQGTKIAVASPGQNASRIATEVFAAGGNLIDAAVAGAFAIAVEVPQGAGLGGGGFMTLRYGGQDYFVDFRETAPYRATRDMYLDKTGTEIPELSVHGPLSIATPGFVAGLYDIHKKWGKLPWKDVLAPSALLAEKGFRIGAGLAEEINDSKDLLKGDATLRNIFFTAKGNPLPKGALLVQKDLAATLKAIGEKGREEFYYGQTGKKIAHFLRLKGGILTSADLERYEVRYREPVKGKWNGYTFLSAPPPSAGGVLLSEMLNILEPTDLKALGLRQSEYIHYLSETMRRAYSDRATYIGDPDFVKTGYEKLMTKEYATSVRDHISRELATPSSQVAPVTTKEKKHTAHLSAMDAQGNAVSTTLTINSSFGSGMAAPGTGIILNNEMDDFSVKPGTKNIYGLTGGDANSIASHKRPVSSMTPTILLKDNQPVLAIGAAGGSRIITAVMQVILNNRVHYPGDLKRSVFAPRFHHQWLPDRIELEEGLSATAKTELQKRGHDLSPPPYPVVLQAVEREADGDLVAVRDPREDGGASAK